ncbi:MAG: LPS assembly protein LptD [Proteobacteria bacterium]|nr:LPS assembly protein LptD [Pseudomonadota bacterium]
MCLAAAALLTLATPYLAAAHDANPGTPLDAPTATPVPAPVPGPIPGLSPGQIPALISADSVTYDEDLGVVTASGNVEISQDGRTLIADTVSYNLRTDVVTASGNVSLIEGTGDVLFADFVELTNNLREGFIRDIRVLLSDRSRLAAVSGVRTGGNKTVFRKGVYSPCRSCRDDPSKTPLWQLKAIEIEHDQEEKVIRYRDAWMEIFGVPVFYSPYFEHADPTVKRKSGFLVPIIGNSDVLGTTYQHPYYWTLGPDQDFTFSPIFTSKQGIVPVGEYRHLFPNGRIDLRGSATFADREDSDGSINENAFRGHIDSTIRFDIDDFWRWGVDAQRATDDTYMRVYNFSSPRTLTSRAFAERFEGRNYLAANAYLYQGLRATDIDSESPVVLPLVDFNYISEPGIAGGKYTVDANFLALSRNEGRDTRRASIGVGWELPYIGPMGDLYKFTAHIQGDGYWVNGNDPTTSIVNPSGPTETDLTGRIFPQFAAQWRYPWVRSAEGIHQVIEPIAQVVFAPNGSNPDEIPNEDSLDFEFDDTNLFSLNRFTGLDRVDPGTRIDYGLKWTVTGDGGGYASTFIGQSYRLRDADVFAQDSGVEDKLSDIVGRVEIRPSYELSLLYRYRLDKDSFTFRRNEVDLTVGPPALNLDLGYISVTSSTTEDEFDDREELNWTLTSQVSRDWSISGGQRIDLGESQTRRSWIGITYTCDCFLLRIIAERNFFEDREIKPEDVILFSIEFKNLGGFGSNDTAGF